MTAFEPPDFEYFPGLQFNPEIYENTLTDSAGALPINPTFNSVTAPLVNTDSIQRDTATTIHLFDGFPSVTSILIGLQGMLFIFGEWVIAGATISGAGLPAIGFGDGSNDVVFTGVNAYVYGSSAIEMVSGLVTDTVMRLEPTFAYIQSATTTIRDAASNILASFTSALIKFTSVLFEVEASTSASIYSPLFRHRLSSSGSTQLSLSSTSSSLSNGTQASVFAPTTLINGSGSTAVSTTIGNGVAGGTILLNAPSTELRGSNIRFDSTYVASTDVNLNFYSSSFNPTVLAANITASGGTSLPLGGVLEFNVRTLDNNAILYNVNSTTTTFNANVYIASSGALFGAGSAGNLILFNGDGCSNTGATTFNGLNPASSPTNAVLFVQFSKVAATTCNLSTTHRDGFVWYLVNQGQAACTVNYATAQIFGPGLTRGGATTCSIASGGARMFRSCIFPSGSIGGSFTNGWFTTLL